MYPRPRPPLSTCGARGSCGCGSADRRLADPHRPPDARTPPPGKGGARLKGKTRCGTPVANVPIVAPAPPWCTTRSTCGSRSACGNHGRTTTFPGTSPNASTSTLGPVDTNTRTFNVANPAIAVRNTPASPNAVPNVRYTSGSRCSRTHDGSSPGSENGAENGTGRNGTARVTANSGSCTEGGQMSR
ncbi:hypothetical protein GCM10010492_64950 [Saccharothrix mutabilis subsp. mutabilis]|uniref:Uncharacterized protein n=1 Tax=Saccharothrix mutabilis subsp. mutabilis TaxID=66855 RepID=A0ABP3E8Z0_9PSEU